MEVKNEYRSNKSKGHRKKVKIKEPNQNLPSKQDLNANQRNIIVPRKVYDSSLYWCMLALSRIYLAFVQTGYIHPDEFHQSLQVVSYDILEIDASKPWEFQSSNPIRSVGFLGLISLPIYFLQALNSCTNYFFNYHILTPNNLILFPRLFMTMLSFIADFCVYKIACRCYVRPWQCLEVFAGSYIMLVYGTRTFSNCIELILQALLLWRVCSSMVDSTKVIRRENVLQDLFESVETMKDKVKVMRVKNKLPAYNFIDSFSISFIVTFGCFVRPTFMAYSLIPVSFWLQRGIVTQEVPFYYFNLRCLSLVPGALFTFVVMVLADSFYYETITYSEFALWNVTANSFTVTPFNFFLYNANVTKLAQHGLHNPLVHIGVNIPLLFGVLGVVGLWSVSRYFSSIIFRKFTQKPKIYSLATMLLFTFIVPVLLLSLIPHQEPRFIIPSLIPLVLLNSDKVSIYAIQKFKFTKHFLFLMWQIWNIVCVVFYGFFHQGGVTKSMIYLHDYIQIQPPSSNFHILFSHMYSPPTFLLMQRIPVYATTEDGKKFMVPKNVTTYDLGSSLSAQDIVSKLNEVYLRYNATSLLCISASMSNDIQAALPGNAHISHLVKIPWHFSLEHLPNLIVNKNQVSPHCNEACLIRKKLEEFSVDIFSIHFNKSNIDLGYHNFTHQTNTVHDEL